MNYRLIRLAAATSVLCITIGIFIRYFIIHPAVRLQLERTSWLVFIGLLILYICMLGSLALVTIATLRICRTHITTRESLLLTAYSALVNFFGPLQSGPAFRALYLKKKHNLLLKDYTAATLVYYFFYAFFSGGCLLFGWLHWWLPAVGLAILAAVWLWLQQFNHLPRMQRLDVKKWYLMALAGCLQVTIFTVIYYVELRSVGAGVHFTQAVIYTGAANLALFVSITPGAIGFRESFLLFSQNLHHISNASIVAANILDRASYIVILLVLTLVLFGGQLRQELDPVSAETSK